MSLSSSDETEKVPAAINEINMYKTKIVDRPGGFLINQFTSNKKSFCCFLGFWYSIVGLPCRTLPQGKLLL